MVMKIGGNPWDGAVTRTEYRVLLSKYFLVLYFGTRRLSVCTFEIPPGASSSLITGI